MLPLRPHPAVLLAHAFAGAAFMLAPADARASQTIFGQTFYSTNNALTLSGDALVWTTPDGANAEMHTNVAPITLSIGQTFQVSFGLRFFEPQGDGGTTAADGDGIRLGLLDLTSQTSADGAHTATTGEGYRFRFNWETPTTSATGGVAHERTFTGSNANYLTSSGGIWSENPLPFNGFGLDADGSQSYPVSFSVQRINATDAVATLSINGVSRTYTDTGDGAFSFDTLVLAKIGDTAPFNNSSTFTITNFSASVIPEPSSAALLTLAGAGLLARRGRAARR